MTRVFNRPEDFKGEFIDGFVSAYARYLRRVPDANGVIANGAPREDKVSVVIGGGSGHYPAFAGYTGEGLADAVVIGDVFTSPSSEQVYRVAKAAASDAGILFSFGKYEGDVMNFGLAQRRLRAEGVPVETVLVTDDVASSREDRGERRGVAGGFFVFKVAGASAARGNSLREVVRATEHANASTSTFGVAFDGCTPPGRSSPLFRVDAGKLELGLGIHGEPGTDTVELMPAADLAKLMVEWTAADRPPGTTGKVAVLLNGLGTIKYEELFVLYKTVATELAARDLEVGPTWVGEYVTSLDLPACSLSLLWLDDELSDLLNAPADTPAFVHTGGAR